MFLLNIYLARFARGYFMSFDLIDDPACSERDHFRARCIFNCSVDIFIEQLGRILQFINGSTVLAKGDVYRVSAYEASI